MKDYNKTLWEDNITLVDARKLNNIEEQVDSITNKILEVESNLNKNADAIDQACTAITGEKFNSIDERIDSEIDRLNKKIDVSMLQQDNKEIHVIENSIEGMTTNMIIKGRTLNNLFKVNAVKDDSARKFLNATTPAINEPKDRIVYIVNNSNKKIILNVFKMINEWDSNPIVMENSITKIDLTGKRLIGLLGKFEHGWTNSEADKETLKNTCIVLDKEEKYIPMKYFEGIKSFGQEENINIISHGRNLFNLEEAENGLLNVNNGQLYKTDSSSSSTYIKVKKNKNYFINGDGEIRGYYGVFYNENKKYVCQKTFSKNKPLTFEQDGYFRFSYATKDDTDSIPATNIIFEEEVSSTEYEPYRSNEKQVSLSSYGFDEGLRGILDKKDELNYIERKAIKRINKYIVTGNENFVGDLRGNYLYISTPLEGCKPGSGNEAICSHFSYIDGLWNKDDTKVLNKEGFDFSGNNVLSFQIATNKLETPDTTGFKKYFKKLYDAGTPVEVYYELLNPIIIPLKDDMNLKTYNKKTYIKFNNIIQGESSFKAPIDTKETLSSLKKENEDIKAILNSILETLNNKK